MINLVEKLRKQIKKRSDMYVSRVVSGSASSFEDYRHLCGIIQAFNECEEIINKTYRSIFELEESLDSSFNREDD